MSRKTERVSIYYASRASDEASGSQQTALVKYVEPEKLEQITEAVRANVAKDVVIAEPSDTLSPSSSTALAVFNPTAIYQDPKTKKYYREQHLNL